MTQEDKKLLLKDICARLPYEVYAETVNELGETHINRICSENINLVTSGWFKEFKPYLRPMSSMTPEEFEEYTKLIKPVVFNKIQVNMVNPESFDYLNKKMFDYRGLIKKGLALVASDNMYE